MSRTEQCIDAVRRAVKRDLSLGDVEAIAQALDERTRSKTAAGLDAATAETRAAQELAEDLREGARIERRNAKLNIATRARFRRHVAGAVSEGADPSDALTAWNVGLNRRFSGNRLSVDARQNAWRAKFVGGLVHDLNAADPAYLKILSTHALDREIAREMWELGRPPGVGRKHVTGSSEAYVIAQVLHKYSQASRAAQNARGAWIRNLPGYIFRQSHDEYRMRKMGFQAWRDFIMPKLDLDRLAPHGNVNEVLEGAWTTIISGGHLAHLVDEVDGAEIAAGFTGAANLAKRVSEQRRTLPFATADDFIDYHARFGRGSLFEGVLHGLEQASQTIGLLEGWGTNPRAMFEAERAGLVAAAEGNPKLLARLRSRQHDYQFAEITGETRIPGNLLLARVGSTVRAVQSMAKLGGAVISSVSDLAMVGAEARGRGGSLRAGYAQGVRSIGAGRTTGERRQVANAIGVGMDGIIGSIAARFAGNEDLPGALHKVQRLFFRLNMLAWWTDAQKTGVGLAIANDLAKFRNRPFGDLAEHLRGALSGYGIGEREWRLMGQMPVYAADGRNYLDPSGVRAVPAEAIKDYMIASGLVERRRLGGAAASGAQADLERISTTRARIEPGQVNRVREDLEQALRAYLVDRTETAVPTPTARERSILTQGTQPGTPLGEALRFITQFKQFPTTVLTRPVGELAYGRGDYGGLAALIVTGTVLGYVAMAAKEVAKGREPPDPTRWEVWPAAMLQGGALGIFGDFLLGQ
ncbi:MAG: hypothetical protein F4X08_12705, partial [Gemmatimonadetes bacterium]|nr:hypothetical protein [Gemmatimonadota bacterium]